MKSFLITFILSSVTLAAVVPDTTNGQIAPAPATTNDHCTPIKLYRKRSKGVINVYKSANGSEQVNVIDHFETTDKDERNDKYNLERQIATICSNPATGTVPLYSYNGKGYVNGKLHNSVIEDLSNLVGFGAKLLGYVYTNPQERASLEIFKLKKEQIFMVNGKKMLFPTYLTTGHENEANQSGYVSNGIFFYSLPLNYQT